MKHSIRLPATIGTLCALALACEVRETLPGLDAGAAEGPESSECQDADGDGYGAGCVSGFDCDEGDASVTDVCYRCKTPQEDCPCSPEGLTAQCGTRIAEVDGYVTCASGERVCEGGAWGPCSIDGGEYRVASTGPGYASLGQTTGACGQDKCDPFCNGLLVDATLKGGDGLSTDANGSVIGAPGGSVTKPAGVCANETVTAQRVKYGIVMMLDSSGSMEDDDCLRTEPTCDWLLGCWDHCVEWSTRWGVVHQPLLDFVNDPELQDSDVGLKFFPDGGGFCNLPNYQGLDVNLASVAVASQRAALRNEINSEGMGGGTPLLAALRGGIEIAKTWLAQPLPPVDAGRRKKSMVLLMTDGEPMGCDGEREVDPFWEDTEPYAREEKKDAAVWARYGYETFGIETWVLGMTSPGVDLTYLNQIARSGSGGVRDAFVLNGAGSAVVTQALKQIAKGMSVCEFGMPRPSSGVIDPRASTMVVKASNQTRTVKMVSSVAECGSGDGAYYDASLGEIVLCPTSCTFAEQDENATIDVTFSCRASCAEKSAGADPGPIDLFVMMDRSGSMLETGNCGWWGCDDRDRLGFGDTRWEAARDALFNFTASATIDTAMGIAYFPVASCTSCEKEICTRRRRGRCVEWGWVAAAYPDCERQQYGTQYCDPVDGTQTTFPFPPNTRFSTSANSKYYTRWNSGLCSEADYRNTSAPGWVSVAPLDATHRSRLNQSLYDVVPYGGTPTRPALQGAIEYMKARRANFPDRQGAVILATDGQPDSYCDDRLSGIKADAAAGRDASVPTYVIGVGNDSDLREDLDWIGLYGGGKRAFMVNGGDAAAFTQGMEKIRQSIQACTLRIPAVPVGGTYSPEQTVVVWTDEAGRLTELPKVADQAGCGVSLAWYMTYSQSGVPELIRLCPQACAQAQAMNARTDVVFQCTGSAPTPGTATYTYDSAAVNCPLGADHVWADFSWDATTPGSSKVEFQIATGATPADLTTWVPLRFTGARFKGEAVCASTPGACGARLTSDTQAGGPRDPANLPGDVFVDSVLRNAGLAPMRYVGVEVTVTTDPLAQAPSLRKPELRVTCKASR